MVFAVSIDRDAWLAIVTMSTLSCVNTILSASIFGAITNIVYCRIAMDT